MSAVSGYLEVDPAIYLSSLEEPAVSALAPNSGGNAIEKWDLAAGQVIQGYITFRSTIRRSWSGAPPPAECWQLSTSVGRRHLHQPPGAARLPQQRRRLRPPPPWVTQSVSKAMTGPEQ